MSVGSDNVVTLHCVATSTVEAELSSISLSPSSVPLGASSTGTVTLSAPATHDTFVQLNSDIGTLPNGVMVPFGATSATFTVLGPTQGTGIVTATLGSDQRSAAFTVLPALALTGLSCPPTVPLGASVNCTVTLNEPTAQAVTLGVSADPSADLFINLPPTVAAGASSDQFEVEGSAEGSAKITVTLGSDSVSTTVNVTNLCTGQTPPPQPNATPDGCDPSTGAPLYRCNANFADKNGDLGDPAGDGCEIDLMNDVHNCGALGHDVSFLPNAVAGCSGGQQTLVVCNRGFANLDGVIADGCEFRAIIDIDEGALDCSAPFTLQDTVTDPNAFFMYHFTLTGGQDCSNSFATTLVSLPPGFKYDVVTPSHMVTGATADVTFPAGFYEAGDMATITVYPTAIPGTGTFSISGHF